MRKAFRRIIVATDLTPVSIAALNRAIMLAKRDEAELLIAHVYQPPNLAQAEAVGPGVYEEWDENLRRGVERELQAFVQNARNQLVYARPLVLSGAPHKAIVAAAKGARADLIVVGTHGRKGFSRFLMGSIASCVASTAPCRVMMVRAVRDLH